MLQRVGFIGLGVMGGGMAKNVAEAGFELVVHDANPSAVRALEEHGAHAVAVPREVAESSDAVVTVLPATPQVEQVYLGAGGIVEGLRPGSITIDCSTISPALVDAPAEVWPARSPLVRRPDAGVGRLVDPSAPMHASCATRRATSTCTEVIDRRSVSAIAQPRGQTGRGRPSPRFQ